MSSFDEFLFRKHGLNMLAFGRLCKLLLPQFQSTNHDALKIAQAFSGLFDQGRLDTIIVQKVATTRDEAWKKGVLVQADFPSRFTSKPWWFNVIEEAIALYMEHPVDYKLIKAYLHARRPDVLREMTVGITSKLDLLFANDPLAFGQMLSVLAKRQDLTPEGVVSLRNYVDPVVKARREAMAATLARQQQLLQKAEERREALERKRIQREMALERLGKVSLETSRRHLKVGVPRLSHQQIEELRLLGSNHADYSLRWRNLCLIQERYFTKGIDLIALCSHYWPQLAVRGDRAGTLFVDILLEMVRANPSEFIKGMLQLEAWFAADVTAIHDRAERVKLLFQLALRGWPENAYWRVIQRGNWPEELEVSQGSASAIERRISYLEELTDSPWLWVALVQDLAEGIPRELIHAFSRHAGDPWDVAARW